MAGGDIATEIWNQTKNIGHQRDVYLFALQSLWTLVAACEVQIY